MDATLRKNIIEFLTRFPFLQSENGRRAMLLSAGLEQIIPNIDLSGSTKECITLLVDHLDTYGTLPDGQLAVEQFLQTVATQVGQNHQQTLQGFCKQIHEQFKMTPKTPASQAAPSRKPRAKPTEASAWDVFICYAREDREMARRLYTDLKQAGVAPWIDTENLLPGQKWRLIINQAIKDSSYVITLLSSRSLSKRGFVQKEIKRALDVVEELPPTDIFVIPVRLDECTPMDERLQELHWVDLFPSYEEGLERILRVLVPAERMPEAPPQEAQKPPAIHLRSEPLTVSKDEAEKVFGLKADNKTYPFTVWRPLEYIQNEYEDQGEMVLDRTTGLIWQKSGSDTYINYAGAQKYVEGLNRQKFAGYDDWRLPTIPELMSLLEPEEKNDDLYLDPIFDNTQRRCWSTDRLPEGESGSSGAAWGVYFTYGGVDWGTLHNEDYVRVVRSRRAP